MTLSFGFTLTVNRYGVRDRFGNLPAPTTHTVNGCAAAPAGSQERVGEQVVTLTQDTIYAPYGADVKPSDEVVIPTGQPLDAGTYQVDGSPARWSSPFTGVAFGTVIRLTRSS